FSPDGKWALAVRPLPAPAQLVLLPTGVGEPRAITGDAIKHRIAAWFPDGKRVLFAGNEPGRGDRLYVREVDGGRPRPITPEITGRKLWIRRPVSPDGRTVVVFDSGKNVLYPVEGGEPRAVPGLLEREVPIGWSADGRALLVRRLGQTPLRIFQVDVSTGRRLLWKEVATSEETQGLLTTADGKSYVRGSSVSSSDLYLVEGLR